MFGATTQPAELRQCELALVDVDAWKTYFDFETLRALEADTTDEAWSGRLREQLERFCDTGDTALLAELYDQHTASHAHELAAIGHAHIDTAWLWPLAETYRKCLRSFSSQLQYMADYPDYRFACSQAQQYAWIKERNPDLWERIRARSTQASTSRSAAAGSSRTATFPPASRSCGSSCTASASSSRNSAAATASSGARTRSATRDSSRRSCASAGSRASSPRSSPGTASTKPEHHTFVWQGDDGSEVLGHFPPADTYNSEANVPELLKASRHLPRPRPLAHEPARLRLRRRRRRPDDAPCSRRWRAHGPARAAARQAGDRGRVLRLRSKPSRPSGRSWSASSTSSTTAACTRRRPR